MTPNSVAVFVKADFFTDVDTDFYGHEDHEWCVAARAGADWRDAWGGDVLPEDLRHRFAGACQWSLLQSCSITFGGSYHDQELHEILFRCIMMPMQSLNGEVGFIFGTGSQ